MKLLARWQWIWAFAALVWGVIVYAQTDCPNRPLIDLPQGAAPSASHTEWDARTRRVLIDRLGIWLITSAALYAVGHGIAWSSREYSSDITRLK